MAIPGGKPIRAVAGSKRTAWTAGTVQPGVAAVSRTAIMAHGGSTLAFALFILASWLISCSDDVQAQLADSLDAYPPRWSLHVSDCDARLVEQTHQSDATADGGFCEAVTVSAGHGTQAVLLYPIEPVRPIDELTATLRIKSLNVGLRVGFRVRYPYVIDPLTKRAAEVWIFGPPTRRKGEFQKVGIGQITGPLRLKTMAMRKQYGASADVSSPYVDAVVVNAYGGPGTSTVRLDDLRVEAMVPLSHQSNGDSASIAVARPADIAPSSRRRPDRNRPDRNRLDANGEPGDLVRRGSRVDAPAGSGDAGPAAFPVGRVTRMLQFRGEPLAWIRSLGFDAVWVTGPPTVDLLNEAIRARVRLYCVPPSAPRPELEPLLEPVAGWIVGHDTVMDSRHRQAIAAEVTRYRRLPSRWQRPLIGCPLEDFRYYGSLLDAAVVDAPPRIRSLSSEEVRAVRRRQRSRLGDKPFAVGVSAGPPSAAVWQSDLIAERLGTPLVETFRWQSMWRQVAEAIADAPQAILYRSSRPLTSGHPLDQYLAMALSFINRHLGMIQSDVARAAVDPDPLPAGNVYVARRLVSGSTTFLILTSAMIRGDETLGGDGRSVRIGLPPMDEGKLIWRLTHFSAERLTPVTDQTGTSIEIVSPDVVEVIAISDQVADGGRLASSAERLATQAAIDRWQLARESIGQSESDWNRATAGRLVSRRAPTELLNAARQSLQEAETLVRAGDTAGALRLARRADSWTLKCDWMLHDALFADRLPASATAAMGRMPLWSSPPLLARHVEADLAWWPMLTEAAAGWSRNLLAGGDLDRPDAISPEGWTFGRRNSGWAAADAQWTSRGAFDGAGALTVRVAPKGDFGGSLVPGGYEGTTLLVQSPPVTVRDGAAVRIDAMVRTLGFGGPHHGLLVYDSVGTQDLGVLVRQQPEWTKVTLLRHPTDDKPIRVMFECLGGGEAMIDSVQVRQWTGPGVTPPLRRIGRLPQQPEQQAVEAGRARTQSDATPLSTSAGDWSR